MNPKNTPETQIDTILKDELHSQEMRAERIINYYRAALSLIFGIADIFTLYKPGMELEFPIVPALLLFIAILGGVFYLIQRFSTDGKYHPWLKYATIAFDISIIIMLLTEYKSAGILVGMSPEGWGTMIIAIAIVYNFLSGFRYNPRSIIYSGILTSGLAIWAGQYIANSLIVTVWGMIVVILATILIYTFTKNTRRLFLKLHQRDAMMRFLSKEIIESIERGEISLSPGGEEKKVTILMADIRGFTSISEEMQPQKLIHWLNEYLSSMTNVIFEYRGTLDKFIGDGILAVFGAPLSQEDDAKRALDTAIKMLEVVEIINQKLHQHGEPQIQIGIALHTGMVIAGNIGSPARMEYTVIGDAVNLVSRIEELNKQYDTNLLVTEYTYQQVKDIFPGQLITETTVRGRKEPVKLYGVKKSG